MKAKKLLLGNNQQPAILNALGKEDFERLAKRIRAERDNAQYQIAELVKRRPAVAAYSTASNDRSRLDELDNEIAQHERALVAGKDSLDYVAGVLTAFTMKEIAETDLANAVKIRDQSAVARQAADSVDTTMAAMVAAILAYYDASGGAYLGGHLNRAFSHHLFAHGHRRYPRTLQTSIQSIGDPMTAAQCTKPFADLITPFNPVEIERCQTALESATAALNEKLGQMTAPANDPAEIADLTLQAA